MWVFGYGSLIWDRWEDAFGCTNRVIADLHGYCRLFNKASVRNWGTKAAPGPTLNLSKKGDGVCRGIAFEFPDTKREEILSFLNEREGAAFSLNEVLIRTIDRREVVALVALYNGKNVIEGKALVALAEMVASASGTKGTCASYVNGVAEQLSALGIDDPAVAELRNALTNHR